MRVHDQQQNMQGLSSTWRPEQNQTKSQALDEIMIFWILVRCILEGF